MQRGLWLAMAFGCFVIQAVISLVTQNSLDALLGMVPTVVMLTFFYTIGSGAISFAIEREEGTQIRPVMLGCPAGLTLTVKVVFGILATILLFVTTACSGLLMSQGSLTLPTGFIPRNVPDAMLPVVVLMVALVYLTALLWSMFFSLLTRTVILALGLAVIAMIASYSFVAVVLSEAFDVRRQSPTAVEFFVASLLPIGLSLLLLLVNYLLTHHWLNHVFFDQRTVKSPSFFRRFRLSRSSLDGGLTVEIGGEDRTAFEVIDADVATVQPPPRIGLSLLYSMWGPNRWRHLRFLRWKEALETRKSFLGFLLAAVLYVIWNASRLWGPNDAAGVAAFFGFGACLCCGVMAFRKEQTGHLYQKLADMGLNPRTVWFSKHLVWLVRAFFSFVMILVFAVLTVDLTRGAMGPIDLSWLDARFDRSTTSPVRGLMEIAAGIMTLGLTMYAIGQACSQLIRSSIVSIFVAFLLAMITFGWASACGFFGVPWILSVLPLAVGCLLVTWFRTRSWMLDDHRRQTWTLPAISIIAAVACAYFGTGLFRVYQVPWVAPVYASADGTNPSANIRDGLSDEQRTRLLSPVTAKEKETFAMYRRAAELLPVDSPETKEAVRKILQEATASAECAEFSPADANLLTVKESTATKIFTSIVNGVLTDAYNQHEAGHPDVALDRFRSAFAISRHAAGRGEQVAFFNSRQLTNKTLTAIQQWAQHEDVGKPLLERAMEIIDEHRKQMISLEAVGYATAVVTRNTLNADVLTLTELIGHSEDKFTFLLATQFPGERTRWQRLMNNLDSYDAATTADYRRQQLAAKNGTGNGMSKWCDQETVQSLSSGQTYSHLPPRHLRQSTPAMNHLCHGTPLVRYRQDVATECEIRATKVMLQLLLARSESKTYPETLSEFDASLNDPWNNQPFVWYPKGLGANLMQRDITVVAANTPFLVSTPGNMVRIQPQLLPTAESEALANLHSGASSGMSGFGFDDPEPVADEDADLLQWQQAEEALMRKVFQLTVIGRIVGSTDFSIWKLPAQDVADEAEVDEAEAEAE